MHIQGSAQTLDLGRVNAKTDTFPTTRFDFWLPAVFGELKPHRCIRRILIKVGRYVFPHQSILPGQEAAEAIWETGDRGKGKEKPTQLAQAGRVTKQESMSPLQVPNTSEDSPRGSVYVKTFTPGS